MPIQSLELFNIKSRQYLLITKAALNVPSQEMHSKSIYSCITKQYKAQTDKIKLPQGYAKNIFWRSSRHLDKEVPDSELHDGASLWRKFCAIKKVINNVITPAYVSFLGLDGLPPSGQTKEQILLKTAKLVFDQDQLAARARSKNPAAYKLKPFPSYARPVEWETFLEYGRPAEKPEKIFFIE